MDNSQITKVVRFLKQLGLNDEQAAIYVFLQTSGPSTVLAISRGIKTGRTKLYPALDEMVKKQVVAVHDRHYGTSYEALPPENLEFIVAEHERKSDILRHNLKSTIYTLTTLRSTSPNSSKIIEYRGVDGLKQLTWNLSKANGYFKVYELAGLDKQMPVHFAEKMRTLWVEKKITSYDLTNNPEWTLNTKVDLYKQYSEVRYIDPRTLTIEIETIIYNNVVALISYDKDDIFGVEIYNDKLARQQEQLFDMLWSNSKTITSPLKS